MKSFQSFNQELILVKPSHQDKHFNCGFIENGVQVSMVVAFSESLSKFFSLGDKVFYPCLERIITKIEDDVYHLVKKEFILGKILDDNSLHLREKNVAIKSHWEPFSDEFSVTGFSDDYCGFGYVEHVSDSVSHWIKQGDAVFYRLDWVYELKIDENQSFKIIDIESIIAKI